MKNIIRLIWFLPTFALAQMPAGFNAENMANMEKNMMSMVSGAEDMEKCMSHIDQNKIDEMGVKASQIERSVSELCEQGKRNAAQDKALAFSQEMQKNKELQKMKGCMASMPAMMKSMMQTMPFEELENQFGAGKKHVCD